MSELPAIPAGARVLVVDDEALLAMTLEEMLTRFGCTVTKAARVKKAIELVDTAAFDVALLDVNVAGEPVYPVAEALDQHGVPFVFVTGYGSAALRPDFRGRPTLRKPFDMAALQRALANALATQR